MAASPCRIFLSNIAYNSSEEEVRGLCEQIGPVVSFRIVTDKDTGKPKGFGFCEYKDEATAFSALRNLQDYDLNGRRLRVNFAANERFNHQPMGLQAALDATVAMGGPAVAVGDPLTVHLSKMSRNQLAQMVSEMKGIAVGNKEIVQEMLLANPQLNRALLQPQIMLGIVTSQMMRPIPNAHLLVSKAKPVQTMISPQLWQNALEPVPMAEPQTFPAGVDAAMLQQVVNLPPETVASLAPELREQVIQIQHLYRQGHKFD